MIDRLLRDGPITVNVGLRAFAATLEAQHAPVVQVDWTPPPVARRAAVEALGATGVTLTAAAESRVGRRVESLAIEGVTKRFGPLVAVDDVSLSFGAGVHALVGENGAGKSTLVKAIYGFDPPERGSISVGGHRVEIRRPADARALGIGMVFQQSTLIPAFSVAENIALFMRDLPAALRWSRIKAQVRELSARYGLHVEPAARAGDLSVPELQRVEIVRLLLTGARILILDEPTSTLPAQEIDSLFEIFSRLRDDGFSIVFITHKLPEVLAVADHVTVMRKGKAVGTLERAEMNEAALVAMMFEEEHRVAVVRTTPRAPGASVFELEAVSVRGQPSLHDVTLRVAEGELVGVAGISGEGQRELGDVAIGMLAPTKGRRVVLGNDATRWSVRRIRDAGVSYIPEDVGESGVIWSMTLAENVALANLDRVRRHGIGVDWRKVNGELEASIESLGVELPSRDRRAATLSGGNLQRFAVARELARNPRFLVALYPTRGLDAQTTEVVRQLLVAACDRRHGDPPHLPGPGRAGGHL